jgi:hypothetical protein
MPDYHAYTLDENGHITGRVDLMCPNDEAAKERIKRLMDSYDVELWQLDRFVAVFRTKYNDPACATKADKANSITAADLSDTTAARL